MNIAIAFLIPIISTLIMFQISKFAKSKIIFNKYAKYINFQIIYQSGLLLLSFVILIILYILYPDILSNFGQLGNVNAKAQSVIWLGIGEDETWLSLGLSLSFFITAITATFIYLQFKKLNIKIDHIKPYLLWVILFSFTNSFSEEVIYRLGIIVPLYGNLDTNLILIISAILFGIPHFRGMPNGIIGVLMATLLGWLLAKSIIETQGYFWAWFIHFLQDIVIISALLLFANKNKNDNKTLDDE